MQDSIAQGTLTGYIRFSHRDCRVDFMRGQQDGAKSIPPTEQKDFSSHELRLIQEGQSSINTYSRRLRESLDTIKVEIARKKGERDEKYSSKKETLINRKEMEINILMQTEGEDSPKGHRLNNKLAEKSENYHRMEMDLGRPPLLKFNNTLFWFFSSYILIFAILATLEAPINYKAVEVFFKTSPIFSAAVAVFIGVLYVSLAHIFGILIRQVPNYGSKWKRFFGWFGAVGIFSLAMSMTYILFLMRQEAGVAEFARTAADNVTPFVNGLLQLETSQIAEALSNTAEAGAAAAADEVIDYPKWGLLILNLAVFFIGTSLSIVRHDPHPDFEVLLREREKAEHDLEEFQASFLNRRAAIQNKYERRINEVESWSDVVDADISKLEEKIVSLRSQAADDFDIVLNVIRERIFAYQDGNKCARATSEPNYFGTESLSKLKKQIELTS